MAVMKKENELGPDRFSGRSVAGRRRVLLAAKRFLPMSYDAIAGPADPPRLMLVPCNATDTPSELRR